MTLRGWGIWVRFVMCEGGAAVPERCYGVAVFVICVGLRCVLATGSSRVGLPSLAPAQLVTRWGFFDFVLHPVAFVALEARSWPESPPTAMKIVKERGGFQAEHLAASAESLFGDVDILCVGRLWRGSDCSRPVSIAPFQTVRAVFRHTAYR
jgi:hypothetical protein